MERILSSAWLVSEGSRERRIAPTRKFVGLGGDWRARSMHFWMYSSWEGMVRGVKCGGGLRLNGVEKGVDGLENSIEELGLRLGEVIKRRRFEGMEVAG